MQPPLYPWQEECLKLWFQNGCRGMVQTVTGAGKTYLALSAADRLQTRLHKRLRIKIVVPTGALMQQWKQAIQEFFFMPDGADSCSRSSRYEIGMQGSGFQSGSDCQCIIYIINSSRYRLAKEILSDLKNGDAVLLIADECHRYGSEQNKLIFEFLPFLL